MYVETIEYVYIWSYSSVIYERLPDDNFMAGSTFLSYPPHPSTYTRGENEEKRIVVQSERSINHDRETPSEKAFTFIKHCENQTKETLLTSIVARSYQNNTFLFTCHILLCT
jgi:hypothetical protein